MIGTSHGSRFGELEREVDALVERLAEAEDPTAAQLHPGRRRAARGLDPVVVGVGRADSREHRPARLEVVVVPVHARVGEPACLLVAQQPERARDLEPRLLVDGVHRLQHPGEQALLGVADRDDEAELRRARGAGRVRRRQHLVEVEEGIDVDVGVEPGRLRAEGAVLGTGARLRVEETLQLDRRAAIGEPHAMRERHEVRERVERQPGDRRHLLSAQRLAPVDELGLGVREDVGSGHGARA